MAWLIRHSTCGGTAPVVMSGIRWRRKLWLLCLSILVACSASENAEKLIALAEQAKQEERLNVAADLYHRAAGLKPDDFNV